MSAIITEIEYLLPHINQRVSTTIYPHIARVVPGIRLSDVSLIITENQGRIFSLQMPLTPGKEFCTTAWKWGIISASVNFESNDTIVDGVSEYILKSLRKDGFFD